jgi:hypothetical protein
MLMKPREGGIPGPLSRRPSGRGQGFFNAPWWLLLLWILIFVAMLLAAEELGFA